MSRYSTTTLLDCLQIDSLVLAVALGIVFGTGSACNPSTPESPSSETDTLAENNASEVEQATDVSSLLARQRNRWRASSVSDYRFTLVRNVAQSPSSETPVSVTVHDGTIASAQYKTAPKIVKVEPEEQEQLPTIDSLFAFIEHSAEEGVDSLRVRYDVEAGFPYTIFVDRSANKTNDEVKFEVRDFVPLPRKKTGSSGE